MKYRYIIPEPPIPRLEPRFYRGRVYDPCRVDKIRIKSNLSVLSKDVPLLDGPIFLKVIFHTVIPASWSKKKRLAAHGTWNQHKPDFSNYLKLIEDCCTGNIWVDDALVVGVFGYKIYSLEPRTELIVMSLKSRGPFNGSNEEPKANGAES